MSMSNKNSKYVKANISNNVPNKIMDILEPLFKNIITVCYKIPHIPKSSNKKKTKEN